MKKHIVLLLLITVSLCLKAQTKKVDTAAILILDHMSDIIGDLTSCAFTVHTSSDRMDPEKGLVAHFGKSEVYMNGPDKMQVNSINEKGHRGYWYNGIQLDYYSFDENNYATINAPATIVETMDSVNKIYGIEFPAADFFYPTFTDDLISSSEMISYLGMTMIDDKECFHILSKSKEMNIQIWITNDGMVLPHKLVINYSGSKEQNLRYEASFSKWQINPDLPDAMFEFLPPAKANAVYLLPKKLNN